MTMALTYALPMYRAKNIGWLSLESLCRQKNIDFKWELIIIEEEFHCLGREAVYSYFKRLQKVGCSRIQYIQVPEWIPLSQKWIEIAKAADSVGFLLAGCDDYAPPNRLSETKAMFDAGAEWTHTPIGLFYDIIGESFGVFDYSLAGHVCGLDKAVLTSILKEALPFESFVSKSVDGWIYDVITSHLKREPITHLNSSDDWKRGLFTDGLNNICDKRSALYGANTSEPFRPLCADDPQSLEEIIPQNIAQALREVRSSAVKRKHFVPKHNLITLRAPFKKSQ
jgi:hypothetical protein